MWGYAGGEVTLNISISPEPNSKKIVEGKGKNGDTVARAIVAMAVFECNANTAYTISSSMSQSGGVCGPNSMIGIALRTG